MDENNKLIYLAAYGEAADFISLADSSSLETYEAHIWKFWPGSLTVSEIRVALDRFYDTPENAPIEIMHALRVVAARASGKDEDTVQQLINKLRQSNK